MAIDQLTELRDEFKRNLAADVGALVRLYERNNGGPGRPGDWLRPLKRSAVVLIASNLESFIEELVCSALAHLQEKQVAARKYPEGFRIWRFKSSAHMRNLSVDNTKELVELTLKLYSEVRPLAIEELKINDIKDSFANPIPKNVDWIMGLLDLKDYCKDTSVTVDGVATKVSAGLNELAKRRNEVAHGDAEAEPSIEDIKRLTKFAQMFATRIMRDASAQTERHAG